MDLLKDLKISVLNVSFVTIYIIRKMLVLLQNHLYFLDPIFAPFFKELNGHLIFLKNISFFMKYNAGKFKY